MGRGHPQLVAVAVHALKAWQALQGHFLARRTDSARHGTSRAQAGAGDATEGGRGNTAS